MAQHSSEARSVSALAAQEEADVQELELETRDGSPLRNALREYIKSHNGIVVQTMQKEAAAC